MPAAGRTDNRGRYPKKAVILLLVTASTLVLGYNTPPIQWVSGTLSLQVKRPEREDAHLLVDDYIVSVIHERIRNMSGMILVLVPSAHHRRSHVTAHVHLVKLRQSLNRPWQALGVPGSCGSQI
jgi:hypothetical protein